MEKKRLLDLSKGLRMCANMGVFPRLVHYNESGDHYIELTLSDLKKVANGKPVTVVEESICTMYSLKLKGITYMHTGIKNMQNNTQRIIL